VLVWRLDRWGRTLMDLVATLQEVDDLNIGFVSLTEALDLTTSTGRAMAGMLAVFAQFERDRPGKAARVSKDPLLRQSKQPKSEKLFRQGISKSENSRHLDIGRTSVRRILAQKKLDWGLYAHSPETHSP